MSQTVRALVETLREGEDEAARAALHDCLCEMKPGKLLLNKVPQWVGLMWDRVVRWEYHHWEERFCGKVPDRPANPGRYAGMFLGHQSGLTNWGTVKIEGYECLAAEGLSFAGSGYYHEQLAGFTCIFGGVSIVVEEAETSSRLQRWLLFPAERIPGASKVEDWREKNFHSYVASGGGYTLQTTLSECMRGSTILPNAWLVPLRWGADYACCAWYKGGLWCGKWQLGRNMRWEASRIPEFWDCPGVYFLGEQGFEKPPELRGK